MQTFSGAHNLEVKVDSGDGLAVIQFMVHEGLSALFEVDVAVRSPSAEIDPGAIVGKPAAFRVATGRTWTGICSDFELLMVEPTGLSTYKLKIVPSLWLLTQRRRSRIFQHKSAPAIVVEALREWGIEPVVRLDVGAHPALEMHTQYDETDYAFVRRTLGDAGITFSFTDGDDGASLVVLSDQPEKVETRAGTPIAYVDSPNAEARLPFVTNVRIVESVQPARFTLRDFDFQHPDFPRVASSGDAPDDRLVHERFDPGSFEIAAGGSARADEAQGRRRAAIEADARRGTGTLIFLATNVLDLVAGDVITIDGHPSPALDSGERLLVVAVTTEGVPEGDWTFTATAVPASRPYRPYIAPAERPRASGVQSAFVVGPEGQEIHVDEHGRVRVRFLWDRGDAPPDATSCWLRVSQGMAGAGYGAMMLPRVGHEVLVAFLEGDPDRPIVVGSVHNGVARPPYALPAGKERSFWKSATSPGGVGSNEIMMDDTADRELLYLHAQKDLRKEVVRDEAERTAGDRTVLVDGDLIFEARGNIILRSDADVIIKGGPRVKINEGSR